MSNKNPLAYTGRIDSTTDRQGDAQFNSADFSVANGVVSLAAGAVQDATDTVKGIASFSANDFAVTSGAVSLNEAIMNYAEVSITAAQVKLLATTPISLVAAPGAGKAIKFMGASFKLVYGSEVFTEAADNLGIKYTNASGVQVSNTIETTGFIDQSADTYTNAEPATDVIVAASACENAALVLDNLNANFGGNASNDSTLEVSVAYRIVSI